MKGYGDIRLLEKDVADKIAAGEVVERPLSVVKELTENSIDAGATSISVEIEKGGREYIRVTDNGCGIAPEQVSLAFMRHATSKIRLEEDLNGIQTLGFRGEALASIAAVSKTELITKTAGEKAGTRIRIHGGETVECGSVASDEGTTIIVRDLFYNTPARRKFLRSDSAEASLVIDYLSKMAIACPDVRIRVKNNGSILFSTLGGGDLLKAIQTVYGAAAEYRLLPVDYNEGGSLRLRGYVSAPTGFRRNRRMQICFVNGRLVKDKTLDNAIDEAYRDKLFDGCYPVVFLFLETDPAAVDVNIHPHKTEVKFYDERVIYEFAVRGIRKALLAPDAENVGEMMAQKAEAPAPAAAPSVSYPGWDPQAECSVAETVNTVSWNEVNNINLSSTEHDDYFSQLRQKEESGRQQTLEETFKEISPQRLTFSSLELVGQVFATYIVLRDENYVYFMDQHAAHERVMYERLLESFNSEGTQTQM
ncbi:MAG: DNA mismatch repair endonuclease MutL, partial [Firmicutes bacterium]|nr:DNA mismatch repair endonuclease MutL [Bacillota bacterium]